MLVGLKDHWLRWLISWAKISFMIGKRITREFKDKERSTNLMAKRD